MIRKGKVGFKMTSTNNYNAHIVQYLMKQRQSDNEIWSGNRTYQGKYFSMVLNLAYNENKLCKTLNYIWI